jgi:glycosyltransferase involved in cell wall biosynthesis
MKILIAITKSNYGGAQRYVYDVATSLSKTNDVTVLFGGQGLLAEKLAAAGIRTISIPELGRDMSLAKDISVFFKILKIFKTEKPDALILNSSKVGGIGSLAGRCAKIKKIIFVAHGFAWNEDRSFAAKAFIRSFYSLIFLFSTKIIAVSDAIREQGSTLPFGKKKIVVVKNGISAAPLLSRSAARQALGISPDAFVIGTIAELHPIKGLSYAIEAASLISIPDFQYIILGEGELRTDLERQIQEEKLGGKVFLKGFVTNAATYMKAFDIFLLPSLSEALAYVVLEAGQAGLPVIATSVGGIPEVIENERMGFLIRPKSPKEIANAVKLLYENKEKADIFAQDLRESVLKNFSLEKMIADTEKVLSA